MVKEVFIGHNTAHLILWFCRKAVRAAAKDGCSEEDIRNSVLGMLAKKSTVVNPKLLAAAGEIDISLP